ncbi:MAG: arsenite methyltransferase [Thermoanaerobaculia bacterium]
MNLANTNDETKVGEVRNRYGRIASGEISGCGCGVGAGCETAVAEGIGYDASELAELPDDANLGLGCGAPIGYLAPQAGETVLDLGSGAGIDAFLAARRVGPTGHVIGVDMTPEMLDKARAGAERMGFAQVEFRAGRLEALPVADASIDAVTSNCVINLVPDKPAVFREIARVLKPGGRLVVSDIVLERPLPEALAADLLGYVGCISGAEQRSCYFSGLAEAGLGEIEILRDVDYLETLLSTMPEEVEALLARTGTKLDDVKGTVRSLTYRARHGQASANPGAGKLAVESCCGTECCSSGK